MTEPRAAVAGYTPLLAAPAAPVPSGLHPPLAGCAPVLLADHAYDKLTYQSSAAAGAEPSSGWMIATEPEEAPWWQIDLGAPVYVERVTLWLAPIAAGTEVRLVAHTFHDKAGEPLQGSFHREARAGDLPVASEGSMVLVVEVDAVARFVRVGLRGDGGEALSLLVRGAEILGARVFADSLRESQARAFTLFADRPVFSARAAPGGDFVVTHRYRDVWATARSLAAALAGALEPDAGDGGDARVFLGLCTRNRPEWVAGDLAAVMRGYVVVPLSPDDGDARLGEILGRVPLQAILVEGDAGDRFARLAARCPSLRLIVTCGDAPGEGGEGEDGDPARGGPVRAGFAELVARGAGVEAPPPRPRAGGDLYTLLFTSGSSGVPKGAMRSYATFLAMLESYGVAEPAVHLSFQPLSHLSERMYLPAVLLQGGLVGFAAGGADLLADLRALEPTVVGSVPRLFEVVFAGHRRRLAEALAAAPEAPSSKASPLEIEARVFAETRLVFGRRLVGLGVGSAPVGAELLAFLQRAFADVFVSDGYGSTECGTIATSGKVGHGVEVKLTPVEGMAEGDPTRERGEIRVRTRFVIDGYYGDPEATRASLDEEGFFRTGDLGERTADGGVRVVGRVSNVIKLGLGEFVAVDRVEAVLAGCPVVDRIFVHPDASSSGLLAVVVPDLPALAALLGAPPDPALAVHPEAARAVARALAEHGQRAGLARFEVPRAVLLEPEPMTAASGILTASGKLARPAAVARYGARLAALGAEAPALAGDGSPVSRLAAAASGVVGRRVDADEPLHDGLGLDSLVVAELIRAASGALGREIPLALWFQARTLADLVRRLDPGTLGALVPAFDLATEDLDLPLPPPGSTPAAAARRQLDRVLLTGATGLLGAHLLESLAARTAAHVVCLVRAPSGEAAAARVREALRHYRIPAPDAARWTAVPGDLGAPDLGLAEDLRHALEIEIDAVVHAGAVVSWLLPYEALRAPNVLGTHALLRLATTGRTKPVHFVSTVSTAPADGDEASMRCLDRARAGGGYGLSKWVAERLVRRAGDGGHPAAVYRPAMITGHSRRGIGNADDYVHRYLRACVRSGRYLDLPDERLDMTPVDFVADGIVALVAAYPEGGGTHHLANLEQSMTYREVGRAIAATGRPCAPCGYGEFRAAAVIAPGSPLSALASYFPEAGFGLHMGPWPSARSRATLAELGVTCPPIDDGIIGLTLRGLER